MRASSATCFTEESIQKFIMVLKQRKKSRVVDVSTTITDTTEDILEVIPSNAPAPVTQVIQSCLASTAAAKSAFVSPDQVRKVGSRKRLCDHSAQSQKRILKNSQKLLQEKMGISPEDSITLAVLMLARESKKRRIEQDMERRLQPRLQRPEEHEVLDIKKRNCILKP